MKGTGVIGSHILCWPPLHGSMSTCERGKLTGNVYLKITDLHDGGSDEGANWFSHL